MVPDGLVLSELDYLGFFNTTLSMVYIENGLEKIYSSIQSLVVLVAKMFF